MEVFVQFDGHLVVPLVLVPDPVLVQASILEQLPYLEAASFGGLRWRAFQAGDTETTNSHRSSCLQSRLHSSRYGF